MTPEEIAARFDEIQPKLIPLWKLIESFNQEEQTIVVVPSVPLHFGGSKIQAFEERFLFLMLLLKQPRARLLYVTSQAILPSVIDYYLNLLPGVIPSQARPRLFLLSPLDGAAAPLTQKVLERPRFIEQLRMLIPNPDRAHLVPYSTTELERELAVQLGIPMFGADPKFFHLGTKSGCRQLFQDEGVPHPIGREDLQSFADVAAAIEDMRREKPSLSQVIVKLNEGVMGIGNAVVDLTGVPEGDTAALEEHIRGMELEGATMNISDYEAALKHDGGIVEERITGEDIQSPSVQLRVTPLGDVELLSTHDQMLGGPSGQTYLGAKFPANPAYAGKITREAEKIGRRLALEGVIGRFALDFVVVRDARGNWDPYAIELNLRKGGTTHPFLTLQFLTDGSYDPESALFTAPSGRHKYFVASDNMTSPLYRAFTPDDLFDLVVRHGLHFDQSRQTGVVFHMMSALPEHGRLGLTAVADAPEEAQLLYDRVIRVLDEEAKLALRFER